MNPLVSAWAMFPAPTNPILIICVFLFFFSYSPQRPSFATDAVIVEQQASGKPCQTFVSYCYHTVYGQRREFMEHSGTHRLLQYLKFFILFTDFIYTFHTIHITYSDTEQAGPGGNASDFYSEGAWFDSRPIHTLSWQQLWWIFSVPPHKWQDGTYN